MFKEGNLRKGYGHRIFASACVGPTKITGCSVVMLKRKEKAPAAVWFRKALELLGLKAGRGCKEREGVFVHYMEVTAPFGAAERNLGCICVRGSTSGKMDHCVCDKEPKYRLRRVGNGMDLKVYHLLCWMPILWYQTQLDISPFQGWFGRIIGSMWIESILTEHLTDTDAGYCNVYIVKKKKINRWKCVGCKMRGLKFRLFTKTPYNWWYRVNYRACASAQNEDIL